MGKLFFVLGGARSGKSAFAQQLALRIAGDDVLYVATMRETDAIAQDAEMQQRIARHLRLPKAITATLAGAALAIAGLQMQTLFRNPLADPFVLGISSGASLGVAFVVLAGTAVGSTLLGGLHGSDIQKGEEPGALLAQEFCKAGIVGVGVVTAQL